MAESWRCTHCATIYDGTPSQRLIDPSYANIYCLNCRQTRTHKLLGEPRALARNTDPVTSHMAAISVQNIRHSQRIILRALQKHGPGTDEDIFALLKGEGHQISLSGARTRRSELVRLGLVEDSGEKKLLPSKRLSIVWKSRVREAE